eukprot:Skav207726  [mRNA]  locus=scaffold362:144649:147083:- [translate_table: standard]
MIAVRFYYLLLHGIEARDRALFNETTLSIDWFYMTTKFKWSTLAARLPLLGSWAVISTDVQSPPGCAGAGRSPDRA